LTIYSEEDGDVPSVKPEKSFPPKFLGHNPGSDEKVILTNLKNDFPCAVKDDAQACRTFPYIVNINE